jgi:transcriptional regulator with XRE-family HTH domain
MGGIAAQLRELRGRASPSISVRAMAEQLGMSPPTYHRYESEKGFKQRYLPMDLARRIAAVLADRGVNPDEVLALAGVGVDDPSKPDLTIGQQKLLDLYDQLPPKRRQLLLQVAEAMIRRD